MKAKLLGVAALLALLGVQPATATTYVISGIYGPDITGTITTDGNTGVLSSADILSYNLTIATGLIPIAVLTPSNSQDGFAVQGTALSATATTLLFNYADTFPGSPYCCDALAGRFYFFDSLLKLSVQFQSVGYVPYFGEGVAFIEDDALGILLYEQGETSEQVIATATPLPAALPLFATGLGALGLLGWRRKRKNTVAIAA